ncbi:MAG: tRNA-specific adenosine deaminase, partial [Clostridiaceae bacterium]|nr:tRNA-specific adenosine deaminase [Clostridiaceae bacterium]
MAAPDHEKRMRQALHQADLARKVDEVPVGALVVC